MISEREVEFLDFGCKDGKSMWFGEKVFSARNGLGMDILPEVVDKAIENGYLATVADATDLELDSDSVRFTLLVHLLEHTPSFELAKKCISSAIRVSRELVYIRHPWFDADPELLRLGCKLYWSDWKVHTVHFNSLDFVKVIRRLGFEGRWCLMGHREITTTEHFAVIPLFSSGRNDAEQWPEVEASGFSVPVYHDIACMLQTGSDEQYDDALSRLDADHIPFIWGHGRNFEIAGRSK